MTVVRTKAGVRFGGFTRDLVALLQAVLSAAALVANADIRGPVVITSASDGRHMRTSKHYTFQALDVRSKNFRSLAAKRRFLRTLKGLLGPRYTVLLERRGQPSEHFHLQLKKGLS